MFSADGISKSDLEKTAIISKYVDCIKIGHILCSTLSFKEIHELVGDKDIFLDFKLHDIPNTVKTAIENYSKAISNFKYFTFHGTASDEMVKAALNADTQATPLAVITLSSDASFDKQDSLVKFERCVNLGVENFICHPHLVTDVKAKFGNKIKLYVPGVRLESDSKDDHFNALTPQKAKELEVDYIIVGRPLLKADNIIAKLQEFI
ncbi:orotidine 5'-phosphate decarboxylase [Allofrancisella guangzhouensis]|uniref:Orotidine 5'-phosphate decarboxylase n=2 Tax=Allofrancisella guangzhouensis TaxID=594679 RepID=A0A0A8E6D6_9GAMM|nr:orotidine 5'-phosphate decarboxylase [Allofrancisella guangzhouensis]